MQNQNRHPNQWRGSFDPQGWRRSKRLVKQFDPIPMSYSRLLPLLPNSLQVQLKEAKPSPTPLPPDYNINAKCEFHFGASGHSIENCNSFKYKVQDLINSKAIVFIPNDLNIPNNPMPLHEGTFVIP